MSSKKKATKKTAKKTARARAPKVTAPSLVEGRGRNRRRSEVREARRAEREARA